jgi:hypothetical protein
VSDGDEWKEGRVTSDNSALLLIVFFGTFVCMVCNIVRAVIDWREARDERARKALLAAVLEKDLGDEEIDVMVDSLETPKPTMAQARSEMATKQEIEARSPFETKDEFEARVESSKVHAGGGKGG